MAEFQLPFGDAFILFDIPDDFPCDVLAPKPFAPQPNIGLAIKQAIEMPVGEKNLLAYQNTEQVAIVVNDKTRPVPNHLLLPPLLEKLHFMGLDKRHITFFIASGTHTPMKPEEYPLILPKEIINNYKIIPHDCDNSPMEFVCLTSYKTEAYLNKQFLNSSLKIAVGNIEPHHFMGYSGGAKSAAIGMASRATIDKNHAMITHPKARSGSFYYNPMRQDVEEIGMKAKLQFCLNTVMDDKKQIMKVLFGDPSMVMKAALPVVDKYYKVPVSHPYDLVIVSPGGYPKDINLYQAQKAITHAASITKDGGYVIVLAECREGVGSEQYQQFVKHFSSHAEVLQNFTPVAFKVGPHKAFQIARDAVRVNIILVSEIPAEVVEGLMITPSTIPLLNEVILWILDSNPSLANVAVMPVGTSTVPVLAD